MQETIKKYGVWVAAGALVLYLVYRQMRTPGVRPMIAPAPAGASGFSADQYRLETERLKQSGAFDLARLQAESALEAARLRAANERYNLEQQALARNRVIQAQQRGQTLGLIGQIAKGISDLFRGQQSQTRGGSSGGASPGTPPIFGGRPQLPPAPNYPIPEPNLGASVFNSPTYVPDWPAPPTDYPLSVTDWGEAPQFGSAGMGIDTGASFYDQFAGVSAPADDFYYGYGADTGSFYSDIPVVSERTYDYMGFDPGGYSEAFYGFDFGGAPAGGGVDPGGYSEEFYGFDFA